MTLFMISGVWTDVLEVIGVLAVIANGLVIGISSDFIPRLVYQYFYGPCASGSATGIDYRDYRSNEDFSLTNQFWVILAARLIFIILFEHVVVMFKCVASWFVPNSPLDVRNERLYDKLKRLKEELRAQRAHQDTLTKLNENGNAKRTSKQKKTNKLNSM
ncbi:hypothetical protein cypCar_00049432 [Cyprinus carpio]|nr:hypothetical protein cypCar_00049432 [Cyprinus carpio]